MTPTKKPNLMLLLPTPAELIALIFLTAFVVVLGSSKQLVSYYGLTSANQYIHNSAGSIIGRSLERLDGYRLTDTIVTFAIWAIIGLFVIAILQAFAAVSHQLRYEEEISSNRFVHPESFKRKAFWRQVSLSFAGLAACSLLMISLLLVFFLYMLPLGLTYSKVFLLDFSFVNLLYFTIGIAIIYVGLAILDVGLRLLTNRHRLAAAVH